MVDGGHGQSSDIVDAGACEMMTRDASWCNLTALAMYTRAGVPLTVIAVCDRQKCEVYALVTSRMVVDDGKWSESTSLLGCWVGERKRTLMELR